MEKTGPKAAETTLLIGKNRSQQSCPLRHPEKLSLAGLTLIELLVVILMLGILIGIAVPRASKSFLNLKLADSSRTISTLMNFARNRAILDEISYRLDFDLNRNQCRLVKRIGDEDVEVDVLPAKKYNLPKDISVERMDFLTETPETPDSITFYPDGSIAEVEIRLKSSGGDIITISTRTGTKIEVLGNEKEF